MRQEIKRPTDVPRYIPELPGTRRRGSGRIFESMATHTYIHSQLRVLRDCDDSEFLSRSDDSACIAV